MIIGTPKEVKAHENRVALTPHVALELTKSGHEVLIEKSAGISTGFISSAMTGYLVINWLFSVNSSGKFYLFSLYCFMVSMFAFMLN